MTEIKSNSILADIDREFEDLKGSSEDVLRMTFKYKKKNSAPALLCNGHTLINFGEIFVKVGLPGQGKTALCEAGIVAHSGKSSFGFVFNSRGGRALLADTERHPDDVSDSYNNIAKRMQTPRLDRDGEIENFTHLTLAEHSNVDELKSIIERELERYDYELLILDGIIDFCLSINDDKEATEVVKWARSLAVKYNLALVCTIHPNKGSESIAGHLGAFLYRWARAILFVRSVKGNKAIKELTGEPEMSKLSHGDLANFSPVYFSWNESMRLLMPCDFVPDQDRGKSDKMEKALRIVFSDDKRYRHSELVRVLKDLGTSESTAKRWVKAAIETGIIDNSNGIYKWVQDSGS